MMIIKTIIVDHRLLNKYKIKWWWFLLINLSSNAQRRTSKMYLSFTKLEKKELSVRFILKFEGRMYDAC